MTLLTPPGDITYRLFSNDSGWLEFWRDFTNNVTIILFYVPYTGMRVKRCPILQIEGRIYFVISPDLTVLYEQSLINH